MYAQLRAYQLHDLAWVVPLEELDTVAHERLKVRFGDRLTEPKTLDTIRDRTKTNVEKLPSGIKQLQNPESYSVKISEPLQKLTDEVAARLAKAH